MKKIFYLIFFILLTNISLCQSYLGKITKQVNFRSDASSYGKILKSLNAGSQIFISSLETENDYYNLIDIASDMEGYVYKSFVKVGILISKSDGVFIQKYISSC